MSLSLPLSHLPLSIFYSNVFLSMPCPFLSFCPSFPVSVLLSPLFPQYPCLGFVPFLLPVPTCFHLFPSVLPVRPPPIPAPVFLCLSLAPSRSHLVPCPAPPPAGPCPSHTALPVPEPDHHLAALAEPPLRSHGGGRGSGAPAGERSGGAEAPLPRRRRDAWWAAGSALGRRGFPVPGPAGGCPGPHLGLFRVRVPAPHTGSRVTRLFAASWALDGTFPRT